MSDIKKMSRGEILTHLEVLEFKLRNAKERGYSQVYIHALEVDIKFIKNFVRR